MSLFKQIERLHRSDRFQREDFFTEIVVQVLRNSRELTLEWLRWLGVTDCKQVDQVKIDSQVVFRKLAGHGMDSRPDIAISLFADGSVELILVESKVDSIQGDTQLQRYVDHLANEKKEREALKRASLVFITRDYEAVTETWTSTDDSFSFKRARWFEFYNILKAHLNENSDGLAEQLKLFMEENQMSLGNQFRSTDLVAMENILSAKALMDETLQGEVSEKIQKCLGPLSRRKEDTSEMQLSKHRRYIVCPDTNGIESEFLIGYWLPHDNPDKPIWVGICLYSDPRLKQTHKDLVQAFCNWKVKTGGSWVSEHLDDETAWSCIRKGKPIHSFLGGEDHVRAIKDHFLQLLDEVNEFKKEYPNLPWLRVA